MRRLLVLFLGVVVILVSAFFLGEYVYQSSRKPGKNCQVTSFFKQGKVNCGYMMSSKDGSVDYYAGKFQEVKKEKEKYYLLLDIGQKTPLKFLISHDSLNVTRFVGKRTPDLIKSDDLLRTGLEGGEATVGVLAGNRFLKSVEAQKSQLPTEVYPYLYGAAKKIADCDRPISYLRSHNFLPLFNFCEIETNDIYLL